jgi:3-methyladenine DNA glycosylase AlkD
MLQELLQYKDETYADFQRKLIPSVSPEKIIGVRTPQLKTIAKNMRAAGTADAFLTLLPHDTFEEDQIHAFILNEEKDFDTCIKQTISFLPHINNWATCDQFNPKAFAKHSEQLLPYIETWMDSPLPYTVRFAVGLLMRHFLDERFTDDYPLRVASVQSDEYYVNMMVAWYFATALAKQYDRILPLLKENRLPVWSHNMAIRKARESYRITPEQKTELQQLKR